MTGLGTTRFPTRSLRYAIRRVTRPVNKGAGIVTAFNDGVVTLRVNRRTEGFHESLEQDGYVGVQAGDLVIHGLDLVHGSVGVSDSDGQITPVCWVVQPRPDMDARFLQQALRAVARAGYIRASAKGVRSAGADFRRWETLAAIRVPSPGLDYQRRAARFIDREIDRIACLDRSVREQRESESDFLRSFRDGLLAEAGKPVRLKFALHRIVDTEHATCPTSPDGVFRVIRTSDVRDGHLNLMTMHRTDEASYHRWSRRRVPQAGDVVFTREAPAGEAAVIPPNVPVCLGQRSVLLVLDCSRACPDFVVEALYERHVRDQIVLRSRSTTSAHLNVGEIGELRIVLPALPEQDGVVARLAAARSRLATLDASFVALHDGLMEYRDALITEAVTGQLDVTRLSDSQLDESAHAAMEGERPEVLTA